jgi:hypothetical protein
MEHDGTTKPNNIIVAQCAPPHKADASADRTFVEQHSGPNSPHTQRLSSTGCQPRAVRSRLLFLASAMSDHMTGQVLVVDGDYSIW